MLAASPLNFSARVASMSRQAGIRPSSAFIRRLEKSSAFSAYHKVLTYVEYRAVSGVFQNIDPPSPSPPGECVLPHNKGGDTHSPGGEGGEGSIFWKTPDIGLASYRIISLRSLHMDQISIKTPNVGFS